MLDVEDLIRAERWAGARGLIKKRLKKDPGNHWLLARLGLTYYEQRRYEAALACEEEALRIEPNCPLALWDYAGSLQMLGRHVDALAVYDRITRRGIDDIAVGQCGEGRAWAKGLVADCYYRMMDSFDALGDRATATEMLEKHLDMRGPGCHSIYPLDGLSRQGRPLSQARRGLRASAR
jgi:tetratricopeptide (TPR) repeat protein